MRSHAQQKFPNYQKNQKRQIKKNQIRTTSTPPPKINSFHFCSESHDGPEMTINLKHSQNINLYSRRTISRRFYRHFGASETVEPF